MRRVIPMLLALTLLAGCAGGEVEPGAQVEPIQAEGIVDLFPSQRTETAETAYADFAVKLLQESRQEGENTLLSPLSVTLALGMTSAGAGGETAEEFAALFGMERGTLSAYCLTLMEDYGDLGGSSETNLVNSLWCDPDLTLDDSFVLTCRDYFNAQLYHADLQSGDTVRAINDWVKEATGEKIPTLLDRPLDDQAVLALLNAVYFKNQFERPFVTPTHQWYMDFHNADGTVTRPQGMSNGQREEIYLSHDGGRGVILPYDDGKLGLLLMLPDEGVELTQYLSGWDGQTIAGLLRDQTTAKVDLVVPKFRAEWSGELNDALKALGLTSAFDPGAADFTPMGHSENGSLFIGNVIHKTAFEVNEKGTEAAAATAVIADAGAAMPTDVIFLTFDRPFVYGIVDLETGAPLFLGTLEQAQSAE